MGLENLHNFLTDYFIANNCEILENSNGKLQVQLTDKMDEILMNRPFYWQYVKKLGYPGEPMQLTLITNPNRREEKGEWIHFGSPRLHQIFHTLQTQGKFTKLYEANKTNQRTALHPWLVLNIKISYTGKHKKDELLSMGLHLINGGMKTNVMDNLEKIPLQSTIDDFSYTITPLVRLKSGYNRIMQYIESYLEQKNHDWAKESWQHLEEEKELLTHFYQDTDEDEGEEEKGQYENRMNQELSDIESRFQPKIYIEVINGGLLYLTQASSTKLLT